MHFFSRRPFFLSSIRWWCWGCRSVAPPYQTVDCDDCTVKNAEVAFARALKAKPDMASDLWNLWWVRPLVFSEFMDGPWNHCFGIEPPNGQLWSHFGWAAMEGLWRGGHGLLPEDDDSLMVEIAYFHAHQRIMPRACRWKTLDRRQLLERLHHRRRRRR